MSIFMFIFMLDNTSREALCGIKNWVGRLQWLNEKWWKKYSNLEKSKRSNTTV